MKNGIKTAMDSKNVTFVNSTGRDRKSAAAAISAGKLLLVAFGLFGVSVTDVAINGTGVACTEGAYALPKATGGSTALAFGTLVGYDFTNDRVTTDLTGGVVGFVSDTANTDSAATVEVTLTNQPNPRYAKQHTADSTNNTDNYVDFTLPFPAAKASFVAVIRNTSNVPRMAATSITVQSTYVVRVSDANLALSEIIDFHAIQVTG